MNSRGPEENLGADMRKRLRRALDDAMRARDEVAASALRSALGAIGNAEAVQPGPAERQLAASEYERAGHADRADRLQREAQVLQLAADGRLEDCQPGPQVSSGNWQPTPGWPAPAGRCAG